MSDGDYQMPVQQGRKFKNATPVIDITSDLQDSLKECQYRLACIEGLVESNEDNEALGLRLREFINRYK